MINVHINKTKSMTNGIVNGIQLSFETIVLGDYLSQLFYLFIYFFGGGGGEDELKLFNAKE